MRAAARIGLRIHVAHIPFVAMSLLDGKGEQLEVPDSVQQTAGRRVGRLLLVADQLGNVELKNVGAVEMTLVLLPKDGTSKSPRALPKARSGDTVTVTLRDLHDGFQIPLDVPAAHAANLDAFELLIEPTHEQIHRCC